MAGKVGRPKKDSPKKKAVTIRFSDEEYKTFTEYASSHHMTMTEALHTGIKLLYQRK